MSLSAKGVHGTGVEFIIEGLMNLNTAFRQFIVHDDIIQAVPGGRKAPDAALKLKLSQHYSVPRPSFLIPGREALCYLLSML